MELPKSKVRSLQEIEHNIKVIATHKSGVKYEIDNEVTCLDFLAQCKVNKEIGEWELTKITPEGEVSEVIIGKDGRIKSNVYTALNDALDILFDD